MGGAPPKNSYDENALTLDDFVAAGLSALLHIQAMIL
jgi:hypothetical protein